MMVLTLTRRAFALGLVLSVMMCSTAATAGETAGLSHKAAEMRNATSELKKLKMNQRPNPTRSKHYWYKQALIGAALLLGCLTAFGRCGKKD